ncbi:lipid A deacylase LpxR family protein [Mucilaginibacter sp. UR6-11]|uniref:lipid A deacylase LpxR family protein n=1 Tax=Mucilaginibacter sp. UR6-11 TaxID=1435644 RepID=UPI001E54295F|nr:lipid A deacylase LpxR family protein [Mucilaginibacter sp. UR6-11]MCC8423873.1 lipid A deacylase LpxR family protein [Mucilaginibacter sp. UR6-11]
MKNFFLPLLFILITSCAIAQNHRDEVGIQSDNDSYLGQGSDRYYTDGLFLFYHHALDVKGNNVLANKVLGFELGQKIFNPRGGNIPSARYVDRPFAGYLYAGANLNFLYKNESNIKFGAQLGVVGPASGAQAAQTWVHKTFGFYTPTGWQYQIKNDVELNLSAEYNTLLARDTAVDLSFTSYANLGNGFTGAGFGGLVRIGVFNKLFNSASTESSVIADNGATPAIKHEFFLYYRPMLNFIGYDATVQGSLFRKHDDPTSDEITLMPQRVMLSNEIGLTYTTNRWTFDAAATFHTKDVKEMVRTHQWGSVTVLYKFH